MPSAKRKRPVAAPKQRALAAPSWRACSRCGRTSPCPPGGVPIGWTMSVERKRVEYICVDCSRANIRAIEGRLTEEYWEF